MACVAEIDQVVGILKSKFVNSGKALIYGNGGSAADSELMVRELMKGFEAKKPVSPEVRKKFHSFYLEEGEKIAGLLNGALPAISMVS